MRELGEHVGSLSLPSRCMQTVRTQTFFRAIHVLVSWTRAWSESGRDMAWDPETVLGHRCRGDGLRKWTRAMCGVAAC